MKEIKIYSTPTCTKCKILKEKLQSKNINFEEINLFQHEDLIDEFSKKGIMTVPIVEVNGELLDFKQINDAINKMEEC